METETKNSNKRTAMIVIITVFVTAMLIVSSYFAFKWYQSNVNTISEDKSSKNSVSTEKEPKENKPEIPSNFSKITVNGVEIAYPTKWSQPKIEATKEDFSGEFPGVTFTGGSAVFGDWTNVINVMEETSIKNSSKDYINKQNEFLLKIYDNKKISEEEFYNLGSYYLPIVNAATIPYNPKYVESANGKWRGVWFLAIQGQGVNCQPNFIGLLYNKEINKVISIKERVISTLSEKTEKEIYGLFSNNQPGDDQNANYKVDQYMKTAYFLDSEVKEKIDSEALMLVSFLK